MSIELKQVAEQSLDLSTPTLREMVTRHAAVIDSRATLEDMPEALAFQIDMARALLREFAAIQQAEAQQPVTGEPVANDGWLQDCGLLYRLTDEQNPQNRDEIKVMMADSSRSDASCTRRAGELLDRIRATHPAPSVPDDVARNAERWQELERRIKVNELRLCRVAHTDAWGRLDLEVVTNPDAFIEAAMLAAK